MWAWASMCVFFSCLFFYRSRRFFSLSTQGHTLSLMWRAWNQVQIPSSSTESIQHLCANYKARKVLVDSNLTLARNEFSNCICQYCCLCLFFRFHLSLLMSKVIRTRATFPNLKLRSGSDVNPLICRSSAALLEWQVKVTVKQLCFQITAF